ncbi:MAG: TonB-dependent receptor plug domain-containing protein, partial [Ketobacter sp.]|nr:TonB-dependent receptor plug domain-containing protein [Ketobacter sp.]
MLAPGVVTSAAEDTADLLELDLATLMTIEISPSADASAQGLSQPLPGGQIASGARLGILGGKFQGDIPFSITSYTSEFITDQQAVSVGDVLQYDASVRVARGFGNFQQLYKVRGLPVFSDDMSYNGLHGILPRQYLAAELIERVEILRGANAFLNGAAPSASGLGGSVNVMPKRATHTDINRVGFGVLSN